uniref:Uncharacterized protein n=1 Tax=Cacopsylla melanoneura TaxID=428564 RepID=A0A8D9BHG8_9HEMI
MKLPISKSVLNFRSKMYVFGHDISPTLWRFILAEVCSRITTHKLNPKKSLFVKILKMSPFCNFLSFLKFSDGNLTISFKTLRWEIHGSMVCIGKIETVPLILSPSIDKFLRLKSILRNFLGCLYLKVVK